MTKAEYLSRLDGGSSREIQLIVDSEGRRVGVFESINQAMRDNPEWMSLFKAPFTAVKTNMLTYWKWKLGEISNIGAYK